MKKLLVIACVTLVIFGCAVVPSTSSKLAAHINERMTLVERIDDSTIALVQANDDNEYDVICGGVWITDHDFITAFHCIEDVVLPTWNINNGQLSLDDPDEKLYIGKTVSYVSSRNFNERKRQFESPITEFDTTLAVIVATDRERDAALIKTLSEIDSVRHSIARVRSTDLVVGEHLHIIGHPVGFYFTYIEGIISGTRVSVHPGRNEHVKVIQINSDAWYGNSGGGAFDSDGNLVGISSFLLKNAPAMTFFVHCDTINDFLQKHEEVLSQQH